MGTEVTWVLEDRLAAMAFPRVEAWPRLAAMGIGAVVSLTRRVPPGDPQAFGIAAFHLPVADFGVPSDSELRRCLRWMRVQLEQERAVVVHCGAGLGRTGTILAAYLAACEGFSAEDAMRLVRQARPGSIETEEQERLVLGAWRRRERRR